MRRSLYKNYSWMYVTFNNVGHDIMGVKFEIEHENNINRIYINLEQNLKRGQEENNSYADTIQLISEFNSLNSIHIRERNLIVKILKFQENYPAKALELELVGDKERFRYSINITNNLEDDMYLNVV
ncbi:hypothetical protein WAX88_20960 (plasmid) [Photobacterium damselae subsp. damselae]|uniref:hypothetical protein n=1 Tax=Photobacterium damselae TaxID=38293 RepID=UPI001F40DC56|nr:hypothetical protein [Photobacterium damselae]UKA31770.1 hypothetical protein IPQ37_21090 [Photobacterium damselae subsp. damselae]